MQEEDVDESDIEIEEEAETHIILEPEDWTIFPQSTSNTLSPEKNPLSSLLIHEHTLQYNSHMNCLKTNENCNLLSENTSFYFMC